MKPTIWIFSLEPIQTRYTCEWQEHIPRLFTERVGDRFNVVQIDGVQKNSQLTPGAFLNFSDTNYWKSSQLCNFLEHHNRGATTTDDHIFFTDVWSPTIIQIKYMKDLLGFNWTLHGMFHAGSYDPNDFLGRACGNKAWANYAEKSFFHACDYNYFATQFHIDLFVERCLGSKKELAHTNPSIVRAGWPMEYMHTTLSPWAGRTKRDLIVFPHRIAPEKQVDIFRDLAMNLPQYEFVVCQDQQLTKDQYHQILSESKIVFSANLQETLGISCYEGALLNSIPMVPNRLSYSEMYDRHFVYPSEWTQSFSDYLRHRSKLCALIVEFITHYQQFLPALARQSRRLSEEFFSADKIYQNLRHSPK